MQLKTKKIIAREFLLFVGILFITLGVYGSLFLYNGVLQWKINSLRGQIQAKEQTFDSLKNTAYSEKKAKQKTFYKDVNERFATKNMVNGDDIKLPEDRRRQLDSIVKKMDEQNAPKEDVQIIVADFKRKYGKEVPNGDKIDGIYSFMKQQGVKNLPDKASFKKSLKENPSKREGVYNYLKSNGVKNLPSFSEFEASIGINGIKKAESKPSPQTSGQQPASIEKLLLQDSLNPQKFWQHLSELQKRDSLSYKWNNQWSKAFKAILKENGITSADEFSSFIKSNTLTEEDKKNKALVKKLRNESWDLGTKMQHYQLNQLDPQEIWNVAFYLLIGLLGLAYPVRLFVLAVKWSVFTLKKEEE